jgi:hypothetical protein
MFANRENLAEIRLAERCLRYPRDKGKHLSDPRDAIH